MGLHAEHFRVDAGRSSRAPARASARKTIRLLLAAGLLSALSPRSASAEWQQFQVGNHLPANTIHCSLEGRNGNLWFGTSAGLVRFDGIEWSVLTTQEGLPDDVVVHLAEDTAGRIWASTASGIGLYDGHAWSVLTMESGLASSDVRATLPIRSDSVWVATGNGLSLLAPEGPRTWHVGEGGQPFNNSVRCLARDRNGDILAGTDEDFVRVDHRTSVNPIDFDRSIRKSLSNSTIVSIVPYTLPALNRTDFTTTGTIRDGSLWMGTALGGIGIWHPEWVTVARMPGLLVTNSIRALYQDRRGDMWIGAQAGTDQRGAITRFDGAWWRPFSAADGFFPLNVSTLLEDRFGSLWVGTLSEGLFRFDRTLWMQAPVGPAGLPAARMLSLAEGPAGDVWVGTAQGVTRWNEGTWRTWGPAQGITVPIIQDVIQTADSTVWVATGGGGVFRFHGDGPVEQITDSQNLGSNQVLSLLEASDGSVWIGTNFGGVSVWRGDLPLTTYRVSDGLAGDRVNDIIEEPDGHLWFATNSGVSRFDPSSGVFENTTASGEGLVSSDVRALHRDRSGVTWFATAGGIGRLEDGAWSWVTRILGADVSRFTAVSEDSAGHIWFGTETRGLVRYNGENWSFFGTRDGLASDRVNRILTDRRGKLWFATEAGLTLLEPDRVAPRAVVRAGQRNVTSSRHLRATFDTAFGEQVGVSFSWSFDGAPFSAWSETRVWDGDAPGDGLHTLRVRARDAHGNVDPFSAEMIVDVDATPPSAILAFPAFDDVVSGVVEVRGTAGDPRFLGYRLEVRKSGAPAWDLLAESSSPANNEVLTGWDTRAIADGSYDLRLSVNDSLGLTGTALVRVYVDNVEPRQSATAPLKINAASGGDVHDVTGAVHLYFPPRALPSDALVTIEEETGDSASVPSPPGGAVLNSPVFRVSWEGKALNKAALLDMAAEQGNGQSVQFVLFREEGTPWRLAGGTLNPSGRLALTLNSAGYVALFSGTAPIVPPSGRLVGDLSIAPRILTSGSGPGQGHVAIGFHLDRSSTASLFVYAPSGLRVRLIESDRTFSGGDNLVTWDGRDDDGHDVLDGLYLVCIEAESERIMKPLVVRR